jgi:hypothetical protein
MSAIETRPLSWWGIAALLFLAMVLIRINDFFDLSQTMLERLQIIKSPVLRLAEKTARSDFSERLTRLAWRRLYWGRLAAQRVVDEAPIGDIDAGWSAYINAAADWNAEVMILIVGLQKHYGLERRRYFEDTILNQFDAFDDALRKVRLSAAMRKLRAAQAPDDVERDQLRVLSTHVKSRYDELNTILYDFALCFQPGKAEQERCQPPSRGGKG